MGQCAWRQLHQAEKTLAGVVGHVTRIADHGLPHIYLFKWLLQA